MTAQTTEPTQSDEVSPEQTMATLKGLMVKLVGKFNDFQRDVDSRLRAVEGWQQQWEATHERAHESSPEDKRRNEELDAFIKKVSDDAAWTNDPKNPLNIRRAEQLERAKRRPAPM